MLVNVYLNVTCIMWIENLFTFTGYEDPDMWDHLI